MELELTRTHLACYDTALDTTVLQEETMEMIVPDACPDILRIADTGGVVCLKSKEALEGRAEVSGTVRCAVLYLPDGETGMRRIEVSIPFACVAEGAAIHPGCTVVASPCIQSADTRSINPRKVLVRVSLAVPVTVFAPVAAAISTGTETAPGSGIEQLKETHNTYIATCVQEKPFTFSDDLQLSGGRTEAAELLKSRVAPTCTESKIIGNKLIFKGIAALHICYRAVDNTLCSADYELPFSQIMEVSGIGEEADCTPEVQLTDLTCALHAGDGRTISVSMGLLAQAVIRQERSVELLADIYSTACDLTAEMQPHTLYHLVEQNTRRQTAREILETGVMARAIVESTTGVVQVAQTREGGRTVFAAEVALKVLYLSEENEVYSVSRQVTVPCQADLPEGCLCTCRCKCPGEVFATPTGGGIEVRFDVDFRYLALSSKRVVAVNSAQIGETVPKNAEQEPSIVLRVMGRERLWDLAKNYRTTMADILQANELEGDSTLAGKLLLIPRKR